MRYITVKLTEDQLNAVIGICYKAYNDGNVANPAFFKRLGDKLTKLAKAKNE